MSKRDLSEPAGSGPRIVSKSRAFSKRLRSKGPEEIVDIESNSIGSEVEAFRQSVGASDSQASADRNQVDSVPLVPYSPLPLPGRTQVSVTASADAGIDAEETHDLGEERWYLGLGSKVVGVQHYAGVISDRESVVLHRQPNNQYDRNAVQILNMRGDQLGHLPREMAAALAPVMDRVQHSNTRHVLRFEGHIPRGSGNVFSMPLRIAIFSQDPDGTLGPQLRDLGQRLRTTYCAAARGAVEVFSSPDASGLPVSDMDEATWKQVYGGRMPKKAQGSGPSIHDIMERELEGIFSTGTSYSSMPELEAQPTLRATLYPHQKKALHWMVQRERGLNVEEAIEEAAHAMPASASDTASRYKRKVPTCALTCGQVFFWTKETTAKGIVFKNLATNSAFKKAPRLPRGGILADDMGLGKTITILALILRDEPRGSHVKSASNLIISPLTVLYTWVEQLRMHAPTLQVQVYHGPNRCLESAHLIQYDVVLTTYDVVRADAKSKSKGLHSVSWNRIVIDEAHVIKGHRTATSKAVCDLNAERRWCLTGTPIQNSVEDLFALARFLRLEPFDHFDWFNRTIVRPLKSQDIVGFERLQTLLRMWCLRRTKDMHVADPITGKSRPLLMLPKKCIEVCKVPLDPGDRVLYEKLFSVARNKVQQLEQAAELGAQFSQVLSLLTRLRQLSCSPALLPDNFLKDLRTLDGDFVLRAAMTALGKDKVEDLLRNLEDAQEDDCSICMEPGCDVVTRCGHPFHRVCIEATIRELGRKGTSDCPLCRRPVKKDELLEKAHLLQISCEECIGQNSKDIAVGSKVRVVVDFLVQNVAGKQDRYLGKPHKAIVFSQFTSLLTLVKKELERRKLAFVCVDGSLAHDKRVHALETFRGQPHVQIILCSLKAAGTGLNLTAADHVLLIDPWWNPSIEDQAIDRAHRLGQQRPVRAVRFVAERTVEERILTVHEHKRAIMEGALAQKSREELKQLRLSLVASLFDPF